MENLKNILLVAIVMICSLSASSQEAIPVKNHILIIDKTGSMVGKGHKGSPNIWSEVKSAVINYIDNVEVGDKITLYTYHEKVDPVMKFVVTGDKVKDDIRAEINKLKADGLWTCTYKAVNSIFDSLRKDEINIIQLYTDGANSKTEKCGSETLNSAIANYRFKKGEYDYLFYITLGFKPSSEMINALGEDGTVISDLNGGVPSINIITPKSLSLEFSKEKLSLNQGFLLYSAKGLDANFKVEIDQSQIMIDSLTRTQNNPEFEKYIYSASSDEKITLKFLNGISDIPDGVYSGFYKYKKKPNKDSYTYIIPNKVKLVFKNITKSTVKIQFKDVKND